MNSDTDLLALYTNIKCLKISQKRKSVSERPESEIECCNAASCSSQSSKLISSITEYDFKIWNNVRIIYQSITHGTLDPEWGGWCAEASDWSEMVTPASYWSVRWHSGTEPDRRVGAVMSRNCIVRMSGDLHHGNSEVLSELLYYSATVSAVRWEFLIDSEQRMDYSVC